MNITSQAITPQTARMPNFYERMDKSLYQKRRFKNLLGMGFTFSAVVFGLFWLAWILITLFTYGADSMMEMPIFTADTPPPASVGGLRNAIVGSMFLTFGGLFIGTPIGMMAGIYLAEFDKGGVIGSATRFMNDILLAAPSIVIGLFVYALMVQRGGRRWSG